MNSVYLEWLLCESSGPLLNCQQSRPLVVLLLSGLGQRCRQIQRLLKEVHQRLFCQQGRQDLSIADHPLALCLRRRARSFHPVWARSAWRTVAGLPDLQHEAGYLGDCLKEVTLLAVIVEHAIERLTELDELALWKEIKGIQRTGHYNKVLEVHHVRFSDI